MEYPNFQYPALQVIAEWFCSPNRHTKFQESKSWEESKRGAVRGQGEKRENPYLLSLSPPLPPSFALTPTLTAAISTRPNKSFSVTWSAALQIAWNKWKFLHVKRVQFPQDFFVHKHGRRFIILCTNMAAVTSCENDPFSCYKGCRVWQYELKQATFARPQYAHRHKCRLHLQTSSLH